MARIGKFDDRIFFCTKTDSFFHLKWDHAIDGVARWWFTNYRDKSGYIKGKLKTPKTWVFLGSLPEGHMYEIRSKRKVK